MAEYPIYVTQKACRVSDATVAEKFFIYRTKAGDRVIACDVQKTTLAGSTTNSDFKVGDASDDDGFATVVDTETGSTGDWVDNSGAYLTNSGGKLYTTPDDIIAIYTPNSTPGTTKPELLVRLWVAED